MDDHMREQVTNILKESMDQGGDIGARATAFSLMKGIIEDGRSMSHQMRDLEDIVYIWKSFENE